MVMPEIRATDAEREQTVAHLREATANGQLTLAEFSDRLEAVFAARTRADLMPITADLGVTPAARPPSRRKPLRHVVAVMSSAKQRGRWRADNQIEAVALMGECKIDLREAEMHGEEIDIRATAIMGQITITVPAGVEVEMDGWAIMGSRDEKGAEETPGWVQSLYRLHGLKAPAREATAPAIPAVRTDLPRVHVTTRVLMGEVKVEHVG